MAQKHEGKREKSGAREHQRERGKIGQVGTSRKKKRKSGAQGHQRDGGKSGARKHEGERGRT